MKECWDADPLKRPDVNALEKRMSRINLDYQNMSDELFKSEIDILEMNKVEENYMSSRLFTSKVHNFGNLPEPRNATEEEQEVFHSKLYDFNIPNNINDFNGSNMQYSDSEELSKEFIKLQINSNEIIQQQNKGKDIDIDGDSEEFINLQNSNKIIQQQMKRKDIDIDDDEKEIIQQKTKRQNIIGDIDDEDEVYNNPNLHSEEQDELEIPDDGF
ncbi:hypothetical protein RhiirA4_545607 [Rhizophagus irregularis]|uniref:Serine-threonine/tyrosine-protein kinase catalytic domain-containing protein n=1 Tax=Rhizophagus irregularis TaxID=588596 RepID=A0A2I1GTQ7_9GLOM|nr:hypothetical protein RhiirA4_545607 [Rhizophagus irregularis]